MTGKSAPKGRQAWRAACISTAVFTLFLCSALTSAQPKYPVRMRMEPLSIRGRSGGPIPIRIKLEYNSQQILEGDLQLEIFNTIYTPTDLTATIRYEGIVLQGGDYFFDTVLPPFEHSAGKQYEITAWFETESGRIPLSTDLKNPNEPRELLSIGPRQRATVICSCTGDSIGRRASANRLFLNSALSLDNYNALPPENETTRPRPDDQSVLNYSASWDALDLPENPLHLCSFDVVLLADGALGRLDSAQLEALITWCEAGGSICVLPDDRNLKNMHLAFLRTLFERAFDPNVQLSLSDEGTLQVISDQTDPIIHRQSGIGRATLLPNVQDLAERLTASELGSVVAHLWKARRDSGISKGKPWRINDARQILANGRISYRQQNGRYYVVPNNYLYQNGVGYEDDGYDSLEAIVAFHGLGRILSPKASALSSACETSLMPKGVRMVPASVIALLLAAYVITVGPVDYFVLGHFRIRKYTWILFPFVTAGFTALTVGIAHHYMASSETGGSLTIVDVVADGRPVRQTDLRVHFYGEQRDYQEELKNSFSVPAQMITVKEDPFSVEETSGSVMPNMAYAGRFPQACSTTLKLRQWEPQMTRSMTLTPGPSSIPKIPWDDYSLVATEDGRQALRSKLTKLRTQDVNIDAIVLHNDRHFPLFAQGGFLFSSHAVATGISSSRRPPWEQRNKPISESAQLAFGILEASRRDRTRDFFSIVSQVAPHGAASLEDLPVLDSSDQNQWLLIVAVREHLQTKIFRRLYLQDEERLRNPSSSNPE